MIDERDRAISVALRPLRDELPPADWGGVVALATASAQMEAEPAIEGATPVHNEPPRHRSVVRLAGLGAVTAVLVLAVVLAGLQGIRTRGSDAISKDVSATDNPRGAFSQILTTRPSTDPDVLKLTRSFRSEHLTLDGVDVLEPRELPSGLAKPLYMVAGSKDVCFVAAAAGGGCTTWRSAANPATPVLWVGTATDDALVIVALVRDDVARMTVLLPGGVPVDLHVAGNVATGRLNDRPARVLTTLLDGTTARYDYDLTLPPDDTLPPTKTMPRSGDRSRSFVRENPALIAAVGPAVVANGTAELPQAVQATIDDLRRRLADCLGQPLAGPNPLPTDSDGSIAKACPAEMAAIDDYAVSRDLNAAGIVRFLTADALERCGRLGRPAEGSPGPPDGATTVTPPAELRCRQAVIGHLPPF